MVKRMSGLGQSRHPDRLQPASGRPRQADIFSAGARTAPPRRQSQASHAAARRANQVVFRLSLVQPPIQKDSVSRLPQIKIITPRSRPTEGRLAIVTNAGRDAVDADGASDESA